MTSKGFRSRDLIAIHGVSLRHSLGRKLRDVLEQVQWGNMSLRTKNWMTELSLIGDCMDRWMNECQTRVSAKRVKLIPVENSCFSRWCFRRIKERAAERKRERKIVGQGMWKKTHRNQVNQRERAGMPTIELNKSQSYRMRKRRLEKEWETRRVLNTGGDNPDLDCIWYRACAAWT